MQIAPTPRVARPYTGISANCSMTALFRNIHRCARGASLSHDRYRSCIDTSETDERFFSWWVESKALHGTYDKDPVLERDATDGYRLEKVRDLSVLRVYILGRTAYRQ